MSSSGQSKTGDPPSWIFSRNSTSTHRKHQPVTKCHREESKVTGEKQHIASFHVLFPEMSRFISLGWRNQVEYDGARNTYDRDERCVWKFSRETWTDHLEEVGVEGRSLFKTFFRTMIWGCGLDSCPVPAFWEHHNEPSGSTPSQNSWPAQPSQRFCAWFQTTVAK
jgi:hypothetical protein